MNIYQLTSEYLELLNLMEDPDADEQIIQDTLEAIGGEIEAKADGYAMVLRQMDADAKAIKAEEDRLYARRKSLENRSTYLKTALQTAMELTGKTKFKTALFSFNIQKNPASVAIDSEADVPAEYWIAQEPKLDKKGIIEFLKGLDGNDGCAWAHLTQSESLRIR